MKATTHDDTNQQTKSLVIASLDDSTFDSLAHYTSYSDLIRKLTKPVKPQMQIEYDITDDIGLIHQYCILREEMFKRIWNLKHFTAEKDNIDEISDIIVARQGLQCIGGGRATFTTMQKRQKLPLEQLGDFSLAAALPELNLAACSYYEVTRIAVLPEFSKESVPSELIGRLILQSIAKGCQYGFFISPLAMTRTHRRVINQLGYTLTTRRDIEIPDREEYEGIKMFLSYVDQTEYVAKQDVAAAAEADELSIA